jgi:hypothetical protein
MLRCPLLHNLEVLTKYTEPGLEKLPVGRQMQRSFYGPRHKNGSVTEIRATHDKGGVENVNHVGDGRYANLVLRYRI